MDDFGKAIKAIDHVRKVHRTRYSNYMLTPLGKEKADEYGGNGLEWDILNFLADNGPSTLREIAQGVYSEEKIVKVALGRLIAKQRVTMVP